MLENEKETLYKLTTKDGLTRRGCENETHWSEGTTHTAQDGTPELCTATVIHAYRTPLQAVLLNPAHANLKNPLLWEASGVVVVEKAEVNTPVELLYIRGYTAESELVESLLLNAAKSTGARSPRFVSELLGKLNVITLPVAVIVKSLPSEDVASVCVPPF